MSRTGGLVGQFPDGELLLPAAPRGPSAGAPWGGYMLSGVVGRDYLFHDTIYMGEDIGKKILSLCVI